MMNLAVPRQSAFPEEALSFALFLTNATNQARFAEEARVLPSASGALAKIEQGLRQPALGDAQEELVRRARLQSLETLEMAEVLVPASPGVKRLQAILYRQLQRAMLGQSSSDEALAAAEREWNSYAVGRWP